MQEFIAVIVVDSNAGLDRDRRVCFSLHRVQASGYRLRFGHQACAELAALNPVTRTANVNVDLIVAVFRGLARRAGHPFRIAPAELQCQWVLLRVVAQKPLRVAVIDGGSRYHLGIEKRGRGQQAHKVTAMPIRPVHHWRDTYWVVHGLPGFVPRFLAEGLPIGDGVS